MDTLNGLFGWREISEEKEVGKALDRGRRGAPDKFVTILGALVFVLLLTSVTSPPTGHAAFPGTNGKIAFTSDRDGDYEIYVMNADGIGVTQLTSNSAFDFEPAWSPDGTKIVFRSNRDGNDEIYVMNADGSGVMNLTNNGAFEGFPAWSPDGTKIAFTSDRDGNWEIYVMNADGSGLTRLTNHLANEFAAAWSPDGTKILFSGHRDNFIFSEVYVMNADGSGVTNLTNNPRWDGYPNWSPDGTKIAFTSDRDGNFEIYVMNADGSGLTRLTNSPGDEFHPNWSPDGTKIAFTSDRDGNFEIYVMNADGGGQTNLTNNPAGDEKPDWQPLPTISVEIDIKPGSFPNSINPRSKGVIPVAILTTDSFDATTVDPFTVLFGPTGTEADPVQSALEDVDGDGDTDMILHFNTQAAGIQCGDTSASLTGATFTGQMIQGSDSIKTVGCK